MDRTIEANTLSMDGCGRYAAIFRNAVGDMGFDVVLYSSHAIERVGK